jgi:hypothetical protein
MSIQYAPKSDGIAARALAAASGGGLARYEAACRAIAEAKSVDEVKAIRDTAEAMRAAAHVAKNKQAEIDMAEIRFRGERRLGELMAAQRSAGYLPEGRPKNGSATDPFSKPVTLAEAGIDKHLADRARKFAAIPDDEFDNIVGDWRERVAEEGERAIADLVGVTAVLTRYLRAGNSNSIEGIYVRRGLQGLGKIPSRSSAQRQGRPYQHLRKSLSSLASNRLRHQSSPFSRRR